MLFLKIKSNFTYANLYEKSNILFVIDQAVTEYRLGSDRVPSIDWLSRENVTEYRLSSITVLSIRYAHNSASLRAINNKQLSA